MAILGAPVLLLPPHRELMYYKCHKAKAELIPPQELWLQAETNLGVEWKNVASSADPALKVIIDKQATRKNKPVVGFEPNWKGALHFGSVVTSHYQQHAKGTTLTQVKLYFHLCKFGFFFLWVLTVLKTL